MTVAKPLQKPPPTAGGFTIPSKIVAPLRPTWTLEDVSEGVQEVAYRILVDGTEGVGKSTFAANAPSPIFIGAESGTNHLNVVRMKHIASWLDVVHGVELLVANEHKYRTVVIDTVDHLEPMLWDHICRRDNKRNKAGALDIESYGYGKGYTAALDEWRRFLRLLEKLREKNVHVVLLAHTHLKTFKNPQGADYDRYELKLNLKAAGLLKEWCDAVLFANYETFSIKEDENDRKGKGVSDGERHLFTERTAAYDAKNRYGLQQRIALSWDAFEEGVKAGKPQDPKVLLDQIERQVSLLLPADQEYAKAAVGRAAGDASKLSLILKLVNTKQPAAVVESAKEGE